MKKRIEKVKFNKKSIDIYFDDQDVLKISEATFTHFYLYQDKELSLEEINEISEYESLNKGKQYVLNLLSKGSYTEKDLLERLMNKKNMSYKDSLEIISYLKEHRLIDDQRYLLDYVESLNFKNYGKNKIIDKCFLQGFKKEMIDQIVFDDEEEKQKAEVLLRKYIGNKKYNFNKLKEKAYAFLINQGFDFEICSSTIKIVDEEYDYSLENELLLKEINKYLRMHSVDLTSYEERGKMISSFVRKGYKYEDINKVLKGVNDDEIC